MIIELFGAPCVGKTTLAAALAAQLREAGQTVELIVSFRPAENPASRNVPAKLGAGRPLTDGLRRLGRPAAEILSGTGRLLRTSEANETTSALIKLFPPRNLLWSIRLRQYMMRLFDAWRRASLASHIVLFDQGFIQAVCSFVLLSRTTDEAVVECALDLVPKSDLPILLVAPQDILEARLVERFRRQGRIEQFLELSIDENLRSIGIIDDLSKLLRHQGRYVPCLGSANHPASDEATKEIGQAVAALARRLSLMEQLRARRQHGV